MSRWWCSRWWCSGRSADLLGSVEVVDDELGAGAGHLPTRLVGELVVAMAQQHTVVVIGGTAVGAVDDVVGVAPPGRPITTGDDTPAISQHEGAADGGGDGSGPPADIERL